MLLCITGGAVDTDPAGYTPPPEREFPGPFPPRLKQAVEIGDEFGRVEMIYPTQRKVVVKWLGGRPNLLEVFRYGPD